MQQTRVHKCWMEVCGAFGFVCTGVWVCVCVTRGGQLDVDGAAWATDNVGLWLLQANAAFSCFSNQASQVLSLFALFS